MKLKYHNLEIEIQAEGIIRIDSLHIVQRLNEHGRVHMKVVTEEEKALQTVEQAEKVSVRIVRTDDKRQTIFCGSAGQIRTEKEGGLFFLHMDFDGYTREWDRTEKSQSFCKGKDTYEQVLHKTLSEYDKAQIRDEVTKGAVIPGILMQYEETDWTFLKRLASHFGTFLMADNSQDYGKAYFGIPQITNNTVLDEKEYTVLKGKEQYEKLPDTEDMMPQEMMRWRIRSLRAMQFGEQVMLGHIETVVTAVDIRTMQGDLVYEYELSRRAGIVTARKTNPRIFGMSIPATVKERKGNQIRVQMDIDGVYEPSDDLKWFTYAIETSNFYCMPEEGSRVHIYFPAHEEQSAMAVHALRMGGSAGSGSTGGGHTQSAPSQTGGHASGDTYHPGEGGGSYNGDNEDYNGGGSADSSGISGGVGGGAAAALQAAASEEEPQEEKDPDYKVFSDPSGSYLELAPYGITFSPGSGSVAMALQSTGSLSLSGLSMSFNSNNTILVGNGKKSIVENIYVEAAKSLKIALTGGDSQIIMEEETNILSTFVRKDAELKKFAQPSAAKVRADVTADDAANRAEHNQGLKDQVTEMANQQKEELLAQKKAEAEAKVRKGIFSILTVVASVALVVATGGAALPLAIAIGATGAFKTVSAVADIAEGVSDLKKVKNGDLSQSYNFMRDGVFGGNEALYEGAKALNDMVFGFVTGKAVAGNLSKLGNANKVVKAIGACQKNKKLNKGLNIAKEVVQGCVEDYVQNGRIDPVHVATNIGVGWLKGTAMSAFQINSSGISNTFVRKTVNTLIGGGVGTGIDWAASKVTGEPFDLKSSFAQNCIVAGIGQLCGEPIDAVTGAFLIVAADILLPDIIEAIRLERRYRSTDRREGWLGTGWHFAYEGRLCRDGETFHVQLPDGTTAAFMRTEEGFADVIGSGRYTLTYDEIGEEWIVTDLHKHTYYRYHPEGSLKAVTSRNGRSLTFHYENGSLRRMVTALGYVVTFEFHEGKLVRMQDDTGRSIGYRYEGGLLTEVIHMDGGVTRYAYSPEGYLIRPTDQTGLSYLTNEYDGTGRVTLQTLANGDTYRLSYHDREKKVHMEYSAYPGVKEYRYDERMTVREVVYPDGSSEYYEYDAYGNRVLERDRMGWETHKEYDAAGHLVKVKAPQGLITEYHYDDKQDLVRVSDNSGYERLLTYDGSHNITSRIEKASDNHYTECLYGYDDMGRLTKETDGEGHATTYRYEEDSAYPSVTVYGDGTSLNCTYSRNGRKLTEDDGAVRWEYAYNKGGYRTMERDGEGNETRYLYDGMGRKLALYTPIQWKEQSGKQTEYRYDFLERLIDTAYPDGSHERKYRDGEGNVLKEVHPNAYDNKTQDGEGTAYDYDGENRMLRIHYPDGGVERFFYDSNGNRIKHVLPEQYNPETDDGAGWQYAYDEGSRLVSVTGPEGIIEETYAYDLRGNCIRRTDEKGCSTYYAYDLLGRLVQELVPVGEEASEVTYRKTSYVYDDNNNKISEIRHGGNYGADGELLTEGEDLTLTFAYDARNRLVRVEDGQGARVSYRYDARGNRIAEEQVIRSAEGDRRAVFKKIKYAYDKAGRLVKKTELLDDGLGENQQTPDMAVTSYEYDENGNRIRIVTPEGYHISRGYDGRDRLIEEKLEDKANGIERTTYISYDRAGNVTSVKQTSRDGRSRELTYDYDLKDRLTHAGELDGPVFMLSYDKNDRRTGQKQLLAMEEEKYGSLTFRYDIRGNLTESLENDISRQKYEYDLRGNLTEQTDGDGVGAAYRYGLQDEQTHAYTAASRKQGRPAQRLTYDAGGRITGVEDGCGNNTSYGLDAWGRIASVQTAEGGREQYAYDAAGNITETVDANGGSIRYEYNSQGQVCAITDQSGNTETFRYDREGRQVQHRDRKGTVTETRYNIYGQPTLQTCTDSKGDRQVMGTWEYDDFGQLKKSVAGGFCYTYEYRPDGKLLKKWNSGRQVISCDYYKNGSLKSLTDISGKTLYYSYDINGRLETLKDDKEDVITEYSYTNAGRLKEICTSNGITTSYEYDGDGNISRLTIGNGTEEGLLYDAFMLYDLNGNRLGKTGQRMGVEGKQEMNTVFCYDAMNRLTMENRREGGEKYAYDLNGNRLKKQRYHYALNATGNMDSVIDDEESYCYNERNELTERRSLSAVTAYLYDENGSLIREKEGEKETGYRYDLLNRQTHVHLPDGRIQENLYDGEGLRAGLKEGSTVSTFLFYNGEILAECNGDSMPIRRHLTGQGLSHVQNLENNIFHAYHQDEQGSTAYVTGITGGTENLYSYDGFGNLLESREGITNRILYTGQQYDQETGQYYLRARYYNPVIGRFTQEDTYRGDGLNLYAYCDNNPVMYYDPSGHKPCENQNENKELEKPPAGDGARGESKNPNGYSVGDIDEHGLLSPGTNRADGNHNTASEGRVQSHHIIQDKWAAENVPGYKRNDAPAILLETGTDKPHTSITNSQRARRAEYGYNTSIQQEFNSSYRDLINAGVDEKKAQKAIKEAYKYFDGLGAFK